MPDPLPVAKNHAAIQNKISLLLSSQSSLLKTLNPTPTTARKSQPTHAAQDADADLFKHANPNEGVGFVRQSGDDTTAQSKQDKALKKRLMGRQKREEERKKKLVESESEEEQGRSGLGKRKRDKTAEQKADEGAGERQDEDENTQDLRSAIKDADEQETKQIDTRPKKKKNKKKRTHVD